MASLPEQSTATLDPDFATDVREFINSHREPLNPTKAGVEIVLDSTILIAPSGLVRIPAT